jgi:hypothetical protein
VSFLRLRDLYVNGKFYYAVELTVLNLGHFRLRSSPSPISSHERVKILSSKISIFRRVTYDCNVSWEYCGLVI